jgi:hypothetical protein
MWIINFLRSLIMFNFLFKGATECGAVCETKGLLSNFLDVFLAQVFEEIEVDDKEEAEFRKFACAWIIDSVGLSDKLVLVAEAQGLLDDLCQLLLDNYNPDTIRKAFHAYHEYQCFRISNFIGEEAARTYQERSHSHDEEIGRGLSSTILKLRKADYRERLTARVVSLTVRQK